MPGRGDDDLGSGGRIGKHLISWLRDLGVLQTNVESGELLASDVKRLRSGHAVVRLTEQYFGCSFEKEVLGGSAPELWRLILKTIGQFTLVTVSSAADGAAKELAKGNQALLNRLLEELHSVYVCIEASNKIMRSPPMVAISIKQQDVRSKAQLGGLLVNSLSAKLDISEQQVAALFDGKSTHLLVQLMRFGPKQDLEPVRSWLRDLIAEKDHVAQLVMKTTVSDDITGFLRLLAILLGVQDDEIQVCACTLMAKIFHDGDSKYIEVLWNFLRSSFGINSLLEVWHCSPASRPLICGIWNDAGVADKGSNMVSLFRVDLPQCIPNTCTFMDFIHDVLALSDREELPLSAQLRNRDLPRHFVGVAGKFADPKHVAGVRRSALGLLCQVWTAFTSDVERDDQAPKTILLHLNKGFRETSCVDLQLFSLASIFNLLERFASKHKPFAPYLYKTVIFSLIEFHRHEVIRDFIISNLTASLQKMPFAPVDVLVGPLVKQISLQGFSNLDLAFLQSLGNHQRLTEKDGLKLASLAAKIALNDPVFGEPAGNLLASLISRFAEGEAMSHFVVNMFGSTVVLLEKPSGADKRNLVLDALTKIVQMRIPKLNQELIPLLERHSVFVSVLKAFAAVKEPISPPVSRLLTEASPSPILPRSPLAVEVSSLRTSARDVEEGDNNKQSPSPSSPSQDLEKPEGHRPHTTASREELPILVAGFSPKEEDVVEVGPRAVLFGKCRSSEGVEIAKRVLKKALPEYKGLEDAFRTLDPADSGFIEKVDFLKAINSEGTNPTKRALLSCLESRAFMDRRLQDKVRRFKSQKACAGSRPGMIGLPDLESLLTEYFWTQKKAEEVENESQKPRKSQHIPVPPEVRKDIETVHKRFQLRKKIEEKEAEEREKKERERKEKVRKRFNRKVKERRLRAPAVQIHHIPIDEQKEILNSPDPIPPKVDTDALDCEKEVTALMRFKDLLHAVFHHAAEPGTSLQVHLGKTFDELQAIRGRLTIEHWLRFLRSYQLVPQVIPQNDARAYFFKGKKESQSPDACFEDFIHALAVCAASAEAFAFEAEAEHRVFALLSSLRNTVMNEAANQLKHNLADPVQKMIISTWAKLEEVPDYQHVFPESLVKEDENKREAFSVALEIVDDILSTNFNVHLLMPLPVKAQPRSMDKMLGLCGKRHEFEPTQPIDTKLYPEKEIQERKQELAMRVSGRVSKTGFGGNYDESPALALARQGLAGDAGPKPARELSETEKAFLSRVEEMTERSEIFKIRKSEKACVRKEREAQVAKQREIEDEEQRRKRQEFLQKKRDALAAEKKAKEERQAKAKEEQEKKRLELEEKKRAAGNERREKQKRLLDERAKEKADREERIRMENQAQEKARKEELKRKLNEAKQRQGGEDSKNEDDEILVKKELARARAAATAKKLAEEEIEQKRAAMEEKLARAGKRILAKQKKHKIRLQKREQLLKQKK